MNSRHKVLIGIALIILTAIPALGDITAKVVRLDPTNGVVVIDDEASCASYQLDLQPADTVRLLKVGQKVSVDPKARTLAAGTVRAAIDKAAPLDKRNIKIITVDSTAGIVKAEFVTTRESTTFRYDPEVLRKRKELRAGQTVALGSAATAGANGNCVCGQKPDGSCWCVPTITYCCGVKIPGCRCDRERDKTIWPPWPF